MAEWKVVSNLEPTIPASNPRNTIDYIFCYPKARWEVVSTATNRIELSDHLPVSAVVELK